MFKKEKGYALLELLLVVILLGILASLALPRFLTTRDKSVEASCQHNLYALNCEIEEYYFMNGGWPTLNDITSDTGRFPDGPPACTAPGASYRINGNNRAECTVHGTL
jgi:prepilin-type N-terminal cleavage/methylation domain-containing protein